jgi:hypothetical protein
MNDEVGSPRRAPERQPSPALETACLGNVGGELAVGILGDAVRFALPISPSRTSGST